MVKDNGILAASVVITDFDLCRMTFDEAKELAKKKIAELLVEEILNSSKITFEEEMNQEVYSFGKRITARVAILDESLYCELLRKQKFADEINDLTTNLGRIPNKFVK